MPRGGRRSTTWGSSWNLGKTKLIRVPIALADTIISIARQIDSGELDSNCLVTDKNKNDIALLQAKKERVIALLNESLKLKANAGGKIKIKVREAIAILNEED